jgi:CTP synthase
LQIATIEFARNVAKIPKATSGEFEEGSSSAVIDIMDHQKSVDAKGGSMRLGAYPCLLKEGSLTRSIYGKAEISERHRHRFEVNNAFREPLEKAGLIVAGASPDGTLVEIVELGNHPWFIGVQFHPEFQSTPKTPHPLFTAFVGAALAESAKRGTLGGKVEKDITVNNTDSKSVAASPSKVRQGEKALLENA